MLTGGADGGVPMVLVYLFNVAVDGKYRKTGRGKSREV